MNLLKDVNGNNGLAGWGWRGVGLVLVMLVALTGTVWAQGRGQGGGMQGGGMQGRGREGCRAERRHRRRPFHRRAEGLRQTHLGCRAQWGMTPLPRPCSGCGLQRR